MNSKKIIVISIFCLALCTGIMQLSTNNLDFSKYNTGWNGTSRFFSMTDRHTSSEIYNLSSLAGTHNATLLIIAPKNEFTSEQKDKYRSFITEGNTIILADDYGTGNSLLRGIGSHISILSGTLTSADRAYNDSYIVVTYPAVQNHTILAGVNTLVLDKSATLLYGEPLVLSSLFSWIDKDNNKQITRKEILGKYTVVAREKLGKGEIIVISDPSIFVNTMMEPGMEWDNSKFISNILSLNQYLYIDQTNSKTYDSEGVNMIIGYTKSFPEFQILIMGVILLVLSIILIRKETIFNEDT